HIRKTTPPDADAIMTIIEEARRTIAALGIDQWQNGSPNRAMIETDIALGQGYCVEAEGAVIGTFALIENGEPTYDRIDDGAWLTADPAADGTVAYLAIHRVAISVACRGSGVSTAIMDFAADTARRLGRGSLRIDTHRGNVVMRRMLEKHGFTHCGTIYLENGDERVAYERVL
ncbi:MAG: GNAT family N-acetyltransferase, partial [Clostridia bacterium]|nr:GNAT family N-acetyltransferase [Clostridia bacterium]